MPTRAAIWKWLLLLPLLAVTIAFSQSVQRSSAIPQGFGILFSVDSTGDGDNVGSGAVCDDGTGHCTLRAAIQASNLNPTLDGIVINLPAGSVINLPRALPDVSDSVSISGPGADRLTVRRGAGGDYRIFNVTTTGTVAFDGLTISNGLFNNSSRGAGINNSSTGTVNITNCVVTGNIAFNGAGGRLIVSRQRRWNVAGGGHYGELPLI